MGRAPCCDKANVKRGPWSPEEDAKLKSYIESHGTGGNWIALPQKIGLKRCGKSCRLRWLNYLRPNIKHGGFTEDEDNLICSLYISIGSRWSIIAAQLPGRTDNDIKNYWNTRLKKKLFGRHRTREQAKKLDAKKGHEQGYYTVNDYVSVFSYPQPQPQPPPLPPQPYTTLETPVCDQEQNSFAILSQPSSFGSFPYTPDQNPCQNSTINYLAPSTFNYDDFYCVRGLPGSDFQPPIDEIEENMTTAYRVPPHRPDVILDDGTAVGWGDANCLLYPSAELCERKTPQDWIFFDEPRLPEYQEQL